MNNLVEKTTVTCSCGATHEIEGEYSNIVNRMTDGWNVVITLEMKTIDLCVSCYSRAQDLATELMELTGSKYLSIGNLVRKEKPVEKRYAGYELHEVKPEQGVTEGFKYVSFSTSYLSNLTDITELEEQLKGKFYGTVLVDSVCKMGQNSDRLLTVEFDGECFDFDTLKRQDTASRPLRQMLSDFYKERPEYLQASVLSSVQQKMISRGLPLSHTVHK